MEEKIVLPVTESQVEGTYDRKKPDGWLPAHLRKMNMPETAIRQMRKQLNEMKRQLKKYERKDTMPWKKRKGCLQRINEAKRKYEGFRMHAIALLNCEALDMIAEEATPNSTHESSSTLVPSESEVNTTVNGAIFEGPTDETK